MKIILSLSFVVLTAFLTHQFYVLKLNQNEAGREVAAFNERNSDHQVKWEQNIAHELSNSKEHVQVAVRPNWQDQMSYEFLQGQYDVVSENGQIQKLVIQDSKSGIIFNAKDFMSQFGPQIRLYDSYQISKNLNRETINLYDKSGQAAGSFEITRDDKGYVTEVLIK
jgi:hypothetical protein